jgi:hypothetical protein
MREAPEGHPPFPIAKIRARLAARGERAAAWTARVAFALRGRAVSSKPVTVDAHGPLSGIGVAEIKGAPAAGQGGAK